MFTEHPWVSALLGVGTLCEKTSCSLKELALQLETCEETTVHEGAPALFPTVSPFCAHRSLGGSPPSSP